MTNQHTPLAERMRPQSLEQFIGQSHLLGQQAPIRQIIEQSVHTGFLPSMILHGQAGIGKTTLAHLLAKKTKRHCHVISAINAGIKELRQALQTDDGLLLASPIVFIDEIHRFNKAQQDALLHAVEIGTITLIGTTTENPSFSINNALLSRCQIYHLQPLTEDEIQQLIQHAIHNDVLLKQENIHIQSLYAIHRLAHGDARRALNLLELVVAKQSHQAQIVIDDAQVYAIAGQPAIYHDKDGDCHYDMISAMIKSIRGSDADASVYWLARLLVAGEDAVFVARRLVISASEDIGLANPNALLLADAALRSVQQIGMPEARIILAQVAIYLANSPKSNSSYQAINEAMSFATTDQSSVPLHLRNGVTKLMRENNYGVNYIYPHDYPNHYHPQDYLPNHLTSKRFYQFADNPKEQASFAFIRWLKQSWHN